MKRTWHIEILEGGNVTYLCGTGVLSDNRDDALRYDDPNGECAEDYEYLSDRGYNASIETSDRFIAHSPAARLERHFSAE